MRRTWIRRNRGEEEAAQARRENHGSANGGERKQNSTEARIADQGEGEMDITHDRQPLPEIRGVRG
jgi:hypothetical protein